MAITSQQNGTTAALTLSADTNLGAAITAPGIYVLTIDGNPLVNGELLILRADVKVLTGGVARVAYRASYKHSQTDLIKISPPIPSLYSLQFVIRQEGGTGRAFDWNIIQIG